MCWASSGLGGVGRRLTYLTCPWLDHGMIYSTTSTFLHVTNTGNVIRLVRIVNVDGDHAVVRAFNGPLAGTVYRVALDNLVEQ